MSSYLASCLLGDAADDALDALHPNLQFHDVVDVDVAAEDEEAELSERSSRALTMIHRFSHIAGVPEI